MEQMGILSPSPMVIGEKPCAFGLLALSPSTQLQLLYVASLCSVMERERERSNTSSRGLLYIGTYTGAHHDKEACIDASSM